jgi:hypothetical protein
MPNSRILKRAVRSGKHGRAARAAGTGAMVLWYNLFHVPKQKEFTIGALV